MRTNGRFICVEGLDGAGKTTQLGKLRDWLESQGHDVVLTREPGGTAVAEVLRGLLLDPHLGETLDPITELLIVFAARRQHLTQKIRPALAEGKWVLCDRFVDSSYAYQKVPHGLSDRLWDVLMDEVVRDCQPNAVLFYDLPDAVAAERLGMRPGKSDRMDQQKVYFHRNVAAALRSRLSDNTHIEIDADGDVATVHQRTLAALHTVLGIDANASHLL